MAILIKDMLMPESCLECPLFNRHGCKATYQMFHPQTNVAVRVSGCPLIELKPHSRLIDANAVLKELDEMMVEGEVFTTAVNFAQTVINEAPTVIEAEGGV